MKRFLASLMTVVILLANTTYVSAYVSGSSGQWGEDEGVNYTFNSDGTLVIKGADGDEVITKHIQSVCGSDVEDEVRHIIIDNVDTVYNSSSYFTDSSDIESYYINATTVKNISDSTDLKSLKTIVFGDKVRNINEYAFGDTSVNLTNLKVTIPSTVTYIHSRWIPIYSGELTVVCEYGSEAYNWALDKQEYYKNDVNMTINIELFDYSAYSSVTIDNNQKYTIVVPETITFNWGNLGWECDTFLGVIGTVPNGASLKIKTDESFTILGETIMSVETVNVSTEDSNTVNSNTFLLTTLDKDTLDNATDDIEVNDTTETGYRIDYTCVTDSIKLMKQSYTGVMKFLIVE